MRWIRKHWWLAGLAIVAVIAAVAWLLPGQGENLALHPQASHVHFSKIGDPFQGAKLLVPDNQALEWQATQGRSARWIDPLARQPQAVWLIDPQDISQKLPMLVAHARSQHRLLTLVTYYVTNLDCSNFKSGAPTPDDYRFYVLQLVRALRNTHTVVLLEPDSVASACFNAQRASLLKWAVKKLEAAGQYVYLDGGHPDWQPASVMATRLLASGINMAQGFFLNVSNFYGLHSVQDYGRAMVALIGGHRQFIVDTSRNGLGTGAYQPWCNPARTGLGTRPTTNPSGPEVADLWVKTPGTSDGLCGAWRTVPAGYFSPAIARQLLAGAQWLTSYQRRSLPRRVPVTVPVTAPTG
jgi:endoglucanase